MPRIIQRRSDILLISQRFLIREKYAYGSNQGLKARVSALNMPTRIFFLGISSAGIAHVNRFDRRFHTASVGSRLRLPGRPLRRLAITRQSPAAHGRRKTDGRPTG